MHTAHQRRRRRCRHTKDEIHFFFSFTLIYRQCCECTCAKHSHLLHYVNACVKQYNNSLVAVVVVFFGLS